MSDGGLLNLTVSAMADRTKMKYGEQVLPDEVIQGTVFILDRAIEWLQATQRLQTFR